MNTENLDFQKLPTQLFENMETNPRHKVPIDIREEVPTNVRRKPKAILEGPQKSLGKA